MSIRHHGDDEEELKKVCHVAEEEITSVKRSAYTFQCALCPKKFEDRCSFGGHIGNVHKGNWFDEKKIKKPSVKTEEAKEFLALKHQYRQWICDVIFLR